METKAERFLVISWKKKAKEFDIWEFRQNWIILEYRRKKNKNSEFSWKNFTAHFCIASVFEDLLVWCWVPKKQHFFSRVDASNLSRLAGLEIIFTSWFLRSFLSSEEPRRASQWVLNFSHAARFFYFDLMIWMIFYKKFILSDLFANIMYWFFLHRTL